MIDTYKLKIGSVVRLEGTVKIIQGEDDYLVNFKGDASFVKNFCKNAMEHAELVSTPVSYSNAQIEDVILKAIEIMGGDITSFRVHELEDYLRSHEDNSRSE